MAEEDRDIIDEAKENFTLCEGWESIARVRFDYDYKFANGDSHNLYQWDTGIIDRRKETDAPCLTVNKTQQHNLMIINDIKQNKAEVRIRPVGENASFEAAQVFQEVIRHIEYISNAQSAYDNATEFQVQGGMGYWRIVTEYVSPRSFDQEIKVRRVKDPRSVYMDPYINEIDGSDANFAHVFEDHPKKIFNRLHPEYKNIGWGTTFDHKPDSWLLPDTIRVCEYYRKRQKKEKFVNLIVPQDYTGSLPPGSQIQEYVSKLTPEAKELMKAIRNREGNLPPEERTFQDRDVLTDNIEWFKIAGNTIIERGPWLGKYIPIVRVPGIETIIDGVLDRKGHTRCLLDPQKIYNYNTSANVEYGALQTKAPWIAPARAIEGYEEYYKSANRVNHSFMPYNHLDDDDNPVPAPTRPAAPQASPAYVEQMKIAQQEMMMVSGQFQSQSGEQENAKSGVAINARQRQGDRATYHFPDLNAIAMRFTGKIFVDLIPKIYDTKRVYRIEASDGSIMNVTIDPSATAPYQKLQPQDGGVQKDKAQEMAEIIFNPGVGIYDVVADVGPNFATRRQEAFNALTQIAAQNKDFMNIAGDVLWKVADFPEAQVLAERWRKIIPKNITGDALDPAVEQQMHAAADKIEQQLALIAKQAKELADKDNELEIKRFEAETARKIAEANANRLDYEAETKRLVALGNSGPAVTVEQIQPLVKQLVTGMLNAGSPGAGDEADLRGPLEGGTPMNVGNGPAEGEEATGEVGSEPVTQSAE